MAYCSLDTCFCYPQPVEADRFVHVYNVDKFQLNCYSENLYIQRNLANELTTKVENLTNQLAEKENVISRNQQIISDKREQNKTLSSDLDNAETAIFILSAALLFVILFIFWNNKTKTIQE